MKDREVIEKFIKNLFEREESIMTRKSEKIKEKTNKRENEDTVNEVQSLNK